MAQGSRSQVLSLNELRPEPGNTARAYIQSISRKDCLILRVRALWVQDQDANLTVDTMLMIK